MIKVNHSKRILPALLLLLVAVMSFGVKTNNMNIGAPYITVDDHTMFEGGFLVWFGQVPPQRTHLESWIAGSSSIFTYVADKIATGHANVLGVNLIADAYRDFHANPDPFVHTYRAVVLLMDFLTAIFVLLLGREILIHHPLRDWLASLAAGFFLLSFNTFWSAVVARPDTLTTLLSTTGLYFYYRSNFGAQVQKFWVAAALLGLAAGVKLHGAFFVIFATLDLLRVHGWRKAFGYVAPFVTISLLAFFVAAGSLLFDPLLYVKLRVLNAKDDASPWIHWGEQFAVVFYGTAWIIIPLLLSATGMAKRNGDWGKHSRIGSVLFIGLCWLLLFCSIRQLRSYWMLPALPIFYIGAAYAIGTFKHRGFMVASVAAVFTIMAWQCYAQVNALASTEYNQLRTWVTSNVGKDKPMYILGYEALGLPRSSAAIANQRKGIEAKIDQSIAEGESFTNRHVRFWEERARLQLFDMLHYESAEGFTYYSYNATPLDDFKGIISFDEMQYVLLQEKFSLKRDPAIGAALANDFEQVAVLTGPGGHSNGLQYQVFKRK